MPHTFSPPIPPQSNTTSTLDADGPSIRDLPRSDWLRIWATMRARTLPPSLADELQVSIADLCVRSFTVVMATATFAAVAVTLTMVPLDTTRGAVWVAYHFFVYVIVCSAVFKLYRERGNGTLTARSVNIAVVPSMVVVAFLWGSLPFAVGADPLEDFYLATTISVAYCVFGFFWPLGHWPLSLLYSTLLMIVLTWSFATAGLVNWRIVLTLTPAVIGTLAIMSGFVCVLLVYGRYHEIRARERELLVGLLLQDYERDGQDFLWETDESLHLVQVPARMIAAGCGDERIRSGMALDELLAGQPDAIAALRENEPFRAVIVTSGPEGHGMIRLWGQPKYILGRPRGYRGMGSDEQATHDLAEAQRLTERLSAMVELTSGLAHDFNNQLATVMGAVELATLDTDVSERTHGYLRRAIDACLRTRRITSDLVVASGSDASYEPTTFAVLAAITPLVIDTAPLFPTVDLRVEGDDEALIEADKSQFVRAIENLVRNACQALVESLAPRGEVVVSVRLARGSSDVVVVSVQDNGPGVADDLADRVFEPFTTSRRSSGGTGLGLSVARGFAHQANGTLELVPTKIGARFDLSLPRRTGATDLTEDSSPLHLAASDTARLRGLFVVVEDDLDVAENVVAWVEALGGECMALHSVAEAVHWAEHTTRTITCVISDIVLPDGDGFDVIGAFRKIDPDLRGVYMSGYAPTVPSTVDSHLRCPFVGKPFAGEEMLTALRGAGVEVEKRARSLPGRLDGVDVGESQRVAST